jgi:hypothetical protein
MQKYTGTIILGFIGIGFAYLASIFGVDTVLSLGSHATISEWVHNWIQDSNNNTHLLEVFGLGITGLVGLYAHFKFFKPKKD